MDRVVIVSGGTKGIGYACAEKFLNANDKVIVLGRHEMPEQLEKLQALGEVTFVKADVAKEEDCQKAIATAVKKYGTVDVLCNVAGVVGKRGNFVDLDLADIQNTININLMGTIALSQKAAKEMIRKRNGVIINIGSIDGFMANTESIGYHASKGGVKMITQAMARELSPYGIRTVSVAPGWVRTGMIDKPIEEIGGKLHMKGRIIEPEEIANIVYLLSLPEASAVNGSTVMADDGYCSFKGVDGFQAD
jgi:NAD(P)-dependent dehydrogenase (short-subunit alcohol dehydrogenase family)